MVTKGMTVVLVRGGAIPPGTTGKVFWVGETKYGVRVGFKDTAGGSYWTAAANVEVVDPAPVAAPAPTAPDADAPTL